MTLTKQTNTNEPLKLNLQYFAGGGGQDPDPQDPKPTGGDPDPKDPNADPKDPDPKDPKDPKGKEKTIHLTQEEFDKKIQDRLTRDRKDRDKREQDIRDEAERKRLEENEEYKDLSEKQQQQLADKDAEIEQLKADALNEKKASKLVTEGYTEEQTELFKGLVEGETDAEISKSIEKLKEINPPAEEQYADPSPGNGPKQTPQQQGADELGKSLFEKIKSKGKIKY